MIPWLLFLLKQSKRLGIALFTIYSTPLLMFSYRMMLDGFNGQTLGFMVVCLVALFYLEKFNKSLRAFFTATLILLVILVFNFQIVVGKFIGNSGIAIAELVVFFFERNAIHAEQLFALLEGWNPFYKNSWGYFGTLFDDNIYRAGILTGSSIDSKCPRTVSEAVYFAHYGECGSGSSLGLLATLLLNPLVILLLIMICLMIKAFESSYDGVYPFVFAFMMSFLLRQITFEPTDAFLISTYWISFSALLLSCSTIHHKKNDTAI